MTTILILTGILAIAAVTAVVVSTGKKKEETPKEPQIPTPTLNVEGWELKCLKGEEVTINNKKIHMNYIVVVHSGTPKDKVKFKVKVSYTYLGGELIEYEDGDITPGKTITINNKKYHGVIVAAAPNAAIDLILEFKVYY